MPSTDFSGMLQSFLMQCGGSAMASIFGERAHGDAQGVEDVVELLGVVSVGRSSSLESSSAAYCSIESASIHRLVVALSECSGRRCRHVMHAKNCASGSHLGRVGVRAGRCPRSATFASSKRAAGSPQGSRISPLEARRSPHSKGRRRGSAWASGGRRTRAAERRMRNGGRYLRGRVTTA